MTTAPPRIAMVLGAGLGTRMRPLTNTLPKPLVPLAGRPLIDRVLDRLAAAGIETAIVNVHSLADRLEAHLARRAAPPRIRISDERAQLLDTGGGVRHALPMLGDAPFLIHNSDSIWLEPRTGPATLARMIAAWDGERMDCLMLLAPCNTSLGYAGRGDFLIGGDGGGGGGLARIEAEAPTPSGEPLVFAGVSIAHPRLFADSPEGAFSLNLLWDRAMERGRLHGMRHEGLWMHVGSPEALTLAAKVLTDARR